STLDGRTLRILHPGFLNREGGPDFRGAVIQFGGGPPCAGDIEVDIETAGWRSHGHDKNPNFKNVILHVVWAGAPISGSARNETVSGIPTVCIRGKLDASLAELNLWLNSEESESLPEQMRGKCSAPLSELPLEKVRELLLRAAQIRFGGKAAQLQARARHSGWEQSLWEGVFRALGYKHNVWPMQSLAESRARWFVPRTPT